MDDTVERRGSINIQSSPLSVSAQIAAQLSIHVYGICSFHIRFAVSLVSPHVPYPVSYLRTAEMQGVLL